MFVKAIKIAQESMFPIFRWETSGQQANVAVVGTGFFINRKGYFISVAHIFDSGNKNTEFLYFGKLPEHLQQPRLEIKEIVKDDEYDIFVGKIDIDTPKYFYLGKKIPDIGKSVCVSGYPLAILFSDRGTLQLGGVRRYFQPSFVLDKILVNSKGDNGKIRIHDGFLVRDVGLFGMSGGPVFDVNGIVVGMQGSVTQPRISKSSSGRTISVENAVVIRSGRIRDFLKARNIKNNLLGRF